MRCPMSACNPTMSAPRQDMSSVSGRRCSRCSLIVRRLQGLLSSKPGDALRAPSGIWPQPILRASLDMFSMTCQSGGIEWRRLVKRCTSRFRGNAMDVAANGVTSVRDPVCGMRLQLRCDHHLISQACGSGAAVAAPWNSMLMTGCSSIALGATPSWPCAKSKKPSPRTVTDSEARMSAGATAAAAN
jgi:hypothetical protein